LTAPSRPLVLALLQLGTLALPAAEIAFEAIPERVRQHAPELLAARAARAEQEARRDAAGWKPAAALTLEAQPGLASDGVGSLQVGFERPLVQPERLRLEKESVARQIPAAEAWRVVREVELIAAAREAAVPLLLAPLRAERLDRQERAARELADFLTARAAAGELSPLDAGQARLEAAQFAVTRQRVEADRVQAEHRLRALLNWPVGEPLVVTGPLPEPSLEPEELPGEAGGPEAAAARAEAEAARVHAALARATETPESELTLFAEVERAEDAPEGVGQEAFLGIGLRRPFARPGKADAAAREAELAAQRWREEGERRLQAAHLRREAARAEMRAQAALFTAAGGEIAQLATEQERLAAQALQEGLADLSTVLRARAQRLALEETRLDAQEAYHLARVRLLATLGL
jgi:cobalt-zinc-cadmium efflux system outer membrane protein